MFVWHETIFGFSHGFLWTRPIKYIYLRYNKQHFERFKLCQTILKLLITLIAAVLMFSPMLKSALTCLEHCEVVENRVYIDDSEAVHFEASLDFYGAG